MNRVFSPWLLSESIREHCRDLGISEVQAASEMIRPDTGKAISVTSLRRIQHTDLMPTMGPLLAMLTWLNIFDLTRFMFLADSVKAEKDGQITAERVGNPVYEQDHRVVIGRWK